MCVDNLLSIFPGLQEYIEAVSFYHYLKHKDLVGLKEVEERLTFTESDLKASDVQEQVG